MSFDYAAVLEMNMASKYAYMELLVYAAATGSLLTSDYDSGLNKDELIVTGTSDDLDNNHHYNVFIL